MRNLKRALSLALASVMLLSMMVVGSGAAIADVDADKHNVEALEVLKLVKAMVGDGTNINPDQLVTRHEAAVVVSNLLGVDKTAYAAHPFKDVASWANSSVAVCYAEGITGGISATEFGGNNTITTLQAGLFVLKALGWFQGTNDFAIDGWEKATAKAAASIGLFKGVEASANEGLTRNDFATIVFNALNTPKATQSATPALAVNAEGKMFSIYTYSTNMNNAPLKDLLFKDAQGQPTLVHTGERLDSITGRPEDVWTFEGDKEVEIPLVADITFTTEKAIDNQNGNTFAAYLNAEEIIKTADYGVAQGSQVPTTVAKGAYVEIYLDSADDIKYVVVDTYALAKVKAITELTEAQVKGNEDKSIEKAADKITLTISGQDVDVYDVYFDGFDYEKNEYILVETVNYTVNDSDLADNSTQYTAIKAHKAAELVTGKVDATKTANNATTYRVGTKFYSSALAQADQATLVIGAESDTTWALNAAGALAAVVEAGTVASDDYAFIYNVAVDNAANNADGVAGSQVVTVYVVLEDGTKASYTAATETVAQQENSGLNRAPATYIKGTAALAAEPQNAGNYAGKLVAYIINEDGEFEGVSSSKIISGTATALNKDDVVVTVGEGQSAKSYIANAATEFIFVDYNSSKTSYVIETATGNANVNLASDAIQFVVNDKNEIVLAFHDDAAPALDGDTNTVYAILADATPIVTGTTGKEVTTYSVIIDGKPAELAIKGTDVTAITNAGLVKGDVFSYALATDGTLASATKLNVQQNADTVQYVGEGYIVLGGKEQALEGIDQYTIHFDEDGNLTVTDGITYSADSTKDGYNLFVVKAGTPAKTVGIYTVIDERPAQ